ncbi:MAG: hypothetical protein HOV92_12865 [Streptomyces sp.]|nr:hypothetical protein [Streptomyces sp.]
MADTRSARKTTTSTPAKKTAAAKKTATRARAPRKATAKKTTAPPLSLVKTVPPQPDPNTRRRDFITDAQIYANHAACKAGLPVHRIREWRDHRNQTATRPLRDGSLLHYDHTTRTLTWQAICPMGATHEYVLNSPSTAAAARVHADRCTRPHADLSKVKPLTADELAELGMLQTPTWANPDLAETIVIPLPQQRDRALADALTHSTASTDETQPMSAQAIADGLTARAAAVDTETPKEHPEP